MADDGMEITYDDHGDVDIDINIDIDQMDHEDNENQDEDLMIEDARSEAATADDVMVDNDAASYNMDDDDYLPDHVEGGSTGDDNNEITEVEMLRSSEAEAEPADSSTLEDAMQQPVQIEVHSPKDHIVNDTTSNQSHNTPKDQLDSISEPAEVRNEDTKNPEDDNDAAQNEDGAGQNNSHSHSPTEDATNDGSHDVSEYADDVGEATVLQELISQERQIIVNYQNAEYALVASSESDDPDSYFCKDAAALKEPLTILFTIIRDILGAEVGPDEELCLSIDGLGLETSESCRSNNDVTFTQIIDLHTTLLHNDGQPEMPPLYVTLSTKPDFGKLVANMTQYALHGHGFTEISQSWAGQEAIGEWTGSDEEIEDEFSGHEDESYEHVEGEDYEQAENGDANATSNNADNQPEGDETAATQEAEVADETQPNEEAQIEEHQGDEVEEYQANGEQHDQEHQDESQSAEKQDEEEHNDEASAELASQPAVKEAKTEPSDITLGQSGEQLDTVNTTSEVATEEEPAVAADENPEDELIDYGDDSIAADEQVKSVESEVPTGKKSDAVEHDFSSPCRKPGTCFCAKCSKKIVEEYEALNEEMEKRSRASRSSSRTLEASNNASIADQISLATNGEKTESTESKTISAHDSADAVDSLEVAKEGEVSEEEQYEGGEFEDYGEGEYALGDDTTNYEADYNGETGYEQQIGDEYFDGSSQHDPEISAAINETVEVTTADLDEINYDDDDDELVNEPAKDAPVLPEESSTKATASPKNTSIALTVDPKAKVVDEDEINYDDDDDENGVDILAATQTPEVLKPAVVSPQSSAKRPLEESNASDYDGFGSKRARSR